jgi:hypothetical protein
MRLAEDASVEHGGHYSSGAPEVLPAQGIFSERFLNVINE